jgi:curved DNA-binding protein CbpA
MDSYYSLLGIPENAVTVDIKAAFRKAAKELHPDMRVH